MLQFFRKYQRIFFIVITTVIVISFSFFGTQQARMDNAEVQDKKIGQLIDGNPLMKFELQQMSAFIASEWDDIFPPTMGSLANFFNNGVISQDILATKIAILLAENYFDEMKEELEVRFQRIKRYAPYRHPDAKFLNAVDVWRRFHPTLLTTLETIQKTSECKPHMFAKMVELYLAQKQFTPEHLRRVLLYQQKQYPWMQEDQRIYYEDLSLFGFHTVTDWFGQRFIDLVSQFILNAAIYAEQQGYQVTWEEAYTDLLKNGHIGFERQSQVFNLPANYAGAGLKEKLQLIGMTEKAAVSIWRKVLLFRKYFQDMGNRLFVDDLPSKTFAEYANEGVILDLYQLPTYLQLSNFEDFLKLQVYLLATTNRENPLQLSSTFFPCEKIEKEFPQLIERQFRVKVQQVKKKDLALKVGTKQMWEWQLEDKNWEQLNKKFSSLQAHPSQTRKARFTVLEQIDRKTRTNIDTYSREQIAQNHPEWLEEALQKASEQDLILSIRSDHSPIPLEGVTDSVKFVEFLQKLTDKRAIYTDDDQTVFALKIVQKDENKKLLSFSQALEDGTMNRLTEEYLAKEYVKVRSQNPSKYKDEKGDWKSFYDVKSQIGADLFADVLQAIDHECRSCSRDSKSSLDFYAAHYLHAHMNHYLLIAQQTPENVVAREDSLEEQWMPTKSEQKVIRSDDESWIKEWALSLEPQHWSTVKISPQGDAQFFFVREKECFKDSLEQELEEQKKELSYEAQRFVAESFLQMLRDKEVITFSHLVHKE